MAPGKPFSVPPSVLLKEAHCRPLTFCLFLLYRVPLPPFRLRYLCSSCNPLSFIPSFSTILVLPRGPRVPASLHPCTHTRTTHTLCPRLLWLRPIHFHIKSETSRDGAGERPRRPRGLHWRVCALRRSIDHTMTTPQSLPGGTHPD